MCFKIYGANHFIKFYLYSKCLSKYVHTHTHAHICIHNTHIYTNIHIHTYVGIYFLYMHALRSEGHAVLVDDSGLNKLSRMEAKAIMS